ncbi:MAG: universal stress protein [Gemmatimonadota bacterium]
MKIEHILVATDLSEAALTCCAPIGGLARTLGARMTLLHVVGGHEAIPHGAPLAPPIEEPAPAKKVEAARATLEERLPAYGDDVDLTPVVISGGDTADEIVEYAEKNGADLIAVATHGRTGFRHMVLGSVAENVVRKSKIPVIVLPRPKK